MLGCVWQGWISPPSSDDEFRFMTFGGPQMPSPHTGSGKSSRERKKLSKAAVLQKDRVKLICSTMVGGDWWRLAAVRGW